MNKNNKLNLEFYDYIIAKKGDCFRYTKESINRCHSCPFFSFCSDSILRPRRSSLETKGKRVQLAKEARKLYLMEYLNEQIDN